MSQNFRGEPLFPSTNTQPVMELIAEFIIAVFGLVLFRLWVTRVNLDHIPALGRSGIISSYFDVHLFRKDGVKIVRDAYLEMHGRMFKIPFLTEWGVVIGDPKLIEEVKNSRDEDFSAMAAVTEQTQQKYTMGILSDIEGLVNGVRNSLTRNIAARFEDIRDEIVQAFGDEIPTRNDEDWVAVPPLVAMRKIVARISNRLFIGLPLCRDADWLDLNIEFAVDVFLNAEKIKKWPDFLKPIVGRYYSPYMRCYNRGSKHIAGLVKERIDSWGEKDPPNDLITWFLENSRKEGHTVERITMAVLQTNMAAIHTASNTFTYALFRLASHPEYAEPMRQEVLDVVDELGWTKAGMNRMRKIDSFLKESQRMDNLTSFAMRRLVVNPQGYTFCDGTYLPCGTLILIPSNAIHLDEKNFGNPTEFNGFRFSRIRAGDKEDSPRHQMVNTNATNLSFGMGKHACPGRFFAANELKAMMAHVLLNYDLKLENDEESCGHTEWDFQIVPSEEKILWRKRQDGANTRSGAN